MCDPEAPLQLGLGVRAREILLPILPKIQGHATHPPAEGDSTTTFHRLGEFG